ncbi:Carboxylesterase NlhH [Gimesia aquarii]|uniref:Carboxylesterase NlhH n=1 Tax=Gimesia aquarii TaxID=2527964 RepID=A0A517W317_9PLAN|nr:Carboxylesterase NlhH [Gimesia aquarii]
MIDKSFFNTRSWMICVLSIIYLTLFNAMTFSEQQPVPQKFKTIRNIPYDTTIKLGKHFKSLDLYIPASGKNHPIVIWVHGGGWKIGDKRGVNNKPQFFTEHGFILASINYRLYPQATYDQQAQDVAEAIHWVREHAKKYGGNPDQIFLMGHSAGAHLVALVSTNPAYLKRESLSLKSIKGTILLDGAGYDISERIRTAGPTAKRLYTTIFGTDEKTWKTASPITYIHEKQSIPPFLIVHVAERAESRRQSESLEKQLRSKGISSKVVSAQGKTHLTINREIGLSDDVPTQKILEFLKNVRKPSQDK